MFGLKCLAEKRVPMVSVFGYPPSTQNAPEQERLCWGFLSHEAAHVRYTDFTLDYDGSALRRRLTNLLEDIRIEKAISREYPGAAFSLAEVVRQLVEDGRLGAPKQCDPPVKVLHDALLAFLRFEVLGQKALEQEAAKAREVMAACFPKQVMTSLNGLLAQMPDLGSTRDALTLADQIIGLFQNLSNEHSENKESGEGGKGKAENSSGHQETGSQDSESQHQEDKPDSQSGEALESDSAQEEQTNSENRSGNNEDATDKAEASFLKQILESTDEDWPEDIFQSLANEMEGWSSQQGGGLSEVTSTPQVEEVVITEKDRRLERNCFGK